ncbi:MAG: hypothetical protein PVJ49_05900, partial [Acidobacteriota bacterium]
MKALRTLAALFLASLLVVPAIAQQQGPEPAKIVITPGALQLEVGGSAEISAVVQDADGNTIEGIPVLFFSTSRRAVGVTPVGQVEAYRPGEYQ